MILGELMKIQILGSCQIKISTYYFTIGFLIKNIST